MLVKNTLIALMGLAIAAEASAIHPHGSGLTRRQQNRKGGQNSGQNQGNNNQGSATTTQASNNNAASGASETCLAANALQTGSQSTGQNNDVAADGQVNSDTYVPQDYIQ
jgi:phage repressor protein C with HTH and peptisase S24 domain